MSALSYVGLLSTQFCGMTIVPYYLYETRQHQSISRGGVAIGSMIIFGYVLPLRLCQKFKSVFPSKQTTQSQSDKCKQPAMGADSNKRVSPVRSILMLYVCVWLYKIIEMAFQTGFYQRCNISNPYQAMLCAIIPGVFLFNPCSTKSMRDYHLRWKSRAIAKLLEYLYYALSMSLIVTISRKYTVSQLQKLNDYPLLKSQVFREFISSWIGLQNNMMPLLVSWLLRDRVYIKFPYRAAVLSSGMRDYWTRWSVHIGSALRYTIYYPLIKQRGYHPLVAVFCVFAFNAFMHHWFAMLLEDKPHFEAYCVGMAWIGFGTFVEIYVKRKWKIANTSGLIKVLFWFWYQFVMDKMGHIMIQKYRAIDIRVQDLQAHNY